MNWIVAHSLRVLIVALVLGALFGQVVIIPLAASQTADVHPEFAHLAVPYSVMSIMAVVCFELALAAVWVLLSMVRRSAIFTERASRWVNVIIGASLVATLLALAMWVHSVVVVQAGGPAAFLGLGGTVVGGAAFVLLMLVMRSLLQSATTYKSELAEVV